MCKPGRRESGEAAAERTYLQWYLHLFFFRLELLAAPRLVNSQSADMQTGKERERGGGRSADIPTVVPTLFFFLLRIEDQGPGSPVSSMCWAYELEACAVQVIRVHFWESFLAFPLEVRQDIY